MVNEPSRVLVYRPRQFFVPPLGKAAAAVPPTPAAALFQGSSHRFRTAAECSSAMILRWTSAVGHVCRAEVPADEGPRRRVRVSCLSPGCRELAEVFVGRPLRGHLSLTPPELPERRAVPRRQTQI
jgi:hypothetical protein